MKLYCYQVDGYNWSEGLRSAAHGSHIHVELFTKSSQVPDNTYVFMRIPQWEPHRSRAQRIAEELYERNCSLIPNLRLIREYESKVIQAARYSKWMPLTIHLRNDFDTDTALRAAEKLGYPFISKTSVGSASKNVRLIKTEEAAKREVSLVKGNGLPCRNEFGKPGVQFDYLLWQKFIPDNSHDYRVIRVGDQYMMLKRGNAPGTPFASGSGILEPVNEPNAFEISALDYARKFLNKYDFRFCGIDMVYGDGRWYVLETTLGWSFEGYLNCRFLGTEKFGKDFFHVIIDELQEGAFA
jgi:glutathione synthase/RimK-type ligase-like ATP-grasp enzyme